MSPTDDRVEQSASPTTMARALRKDCYEERSCAPHKSKTAGCASLPKSRVTLPVCPKCNGANYHGDSSFTRPDDLDCDCNCGFLVDDELRDSDCLSPPGSQEKMAVLSARYHAGKSLWRDGDRSEQLAEAVVAWACGDEQAEEG